MATMKFASSLTSRVVLMSCVFAVAASALISTANAQEKNIKRFAGKTLTFAGYSSTFNEEWAKSFGQYFEKRTGIKINWLPSSPSTNITRIRAAGGSPDIDVMLMDSANLARGAQEGVVGTVDPANIPNMSKVPASLRIQAGIPSMMYRYGVCYRADKFEEHKLGTPNSIGGWSAKSLAGRVMFPNTAAAQWLISAPAIAKSAGGDYANASKTLEVLASKVKAYGLFNSSGDVDAAMTSGDVWLTVGNNQGRCLALKRQKVPVEYAHWAIESDGKKYNDLINPDNLVLVKGSPNKELVELFMNEYLSDEAAAATVPLYRFIAGTPPTKAGVQKVIEADPTVKAWIIEDPDQLFLPKYADFLVHLRDWTTNWSKIAR
ncbi:MAG: extracellular solute-binding protein [Proteobacteria bacterium]|nr:extracellular solute-binding protein [Pseudomonadota bacterium]